MTTQIPNNTPNDPSSKRAHPLLTNTNSDDIAGEYLTTVDPCIESHSLDDAPVNQLHSDVPPTEHHRDNDTEHFTDALPTEYHIADDQLSDSNGIKGSSHPPQSPLAPNLQGPEPLHENQTSNDIERSDVYRCYVPKKAKVNIDKGNLYNLYTDPKF